MLDPACGTGNFLYVTLDLFKRLESEVLALLGELGYAQIGLEMERYRVTPEQFLGIEVKPWAMEIAELVLWIGYLQWQVRQPGGALTVPQPVLRDYGNIECRDAVLTWDSVEPLLDADGKRVTRWDGTTMKVSPVTGEEIPDDTARIPVVRYVNPRRAEWPKADFIVGNPPYIGNKRMRLALGDGYVEALRKAHDDVPETADLVMYWWNQAAELVGRGEARRFGLITTNSITQTFNRKVVEKHLGRKELGIVFAIPDHPWVRETGTADVRVALSVVARGPGVGRYLEVTAEPADRAGLPKPVFTEHQGQVRADLRLSGETVQVAPLSANSNIAAQGVIPLGDGFRISRSDFRSLGLPEDGLPPVVKPYVIGRDLVQSPQERWVIDFFGHSLEEAREHYPRLWQRVFDLVKPERDQNNREVRKRNWWLFGENQPRMRRGLATVRRYIAVPDTSKFKPFTFVAADFLPDVQVYSIATDDAWILGVLSAKVHRSWLEEVAPRLGVGNDLRWKPSAVFLPFPFPACTEEQKAHIRDLGEALDAHRKRQQALHPKLTITGMYNVLEKLRSGEPLDAKDREIHEQGLVSLLRQIHDDLDAAVFDAYGWPRDLSDEQILERLVALNRERAEEEARGLVRWLRPEFQNPAGARPETQATLAEAGLESQPAAVDAKKSGKRPWPKRLAERVALVRDLLAEHGEASPEALARELRGAKSDALRNILESLVAVGLAQEIPHEGGETRWRALR